MRCRLTHACLGWKFILEGPSIMDHIKVLGRGGARGAWEVLWLGLSGPILGYLTLGNNLGHWVRTAFCWTLGICNQLAVAWR